MLSILESNNMKGAGSGPGVGDQKEAKMPTTKKNKTDDLGLFQEEDALSSHKN